MGQSLGIGLRVFDGQNIIQIACESPDPNDRHSPLRIAKNGTNDRLVLVATNAPEAPRILVRTSSGIKALAQLP